MKQHQMRAYLHLAAKRVWMSDWRIDVGGNTIPPDHKLYAQVETTEDRCATFSFAEDFWSLSRREQRDIVAHEFCHLPTRRLKSIAEHLITDETDRMKAVMIRVIDDADEYAAESFAQVLALRIPLPPK